MGIPEPDTDYIDFIVDIGDRDPSSFALDMNSAVRSLTSANDTIWNDILHSVSVELINDEKLGHKIISPAESTNQADINKKLNDKELEISIAKNMWLKESARASKLSDELSDRENYIHRLLGQIKESQKSEKLLSEELTHLRKIFGSEATRQLNTTNFIDETTPRVNNSSQEINNNNNNISGIPSNRISRHSMNKTPSGAFESNILGPSPFSSSGMNSGILPNSIDRNHESKIINSINNSYYCTMRRPLYTNNINNFGNTSLIHNTSYLPSSSRGHILPSSVCRSMPTHIGSPSTIKNFRNALASKECLLYEDEVLEIGIRLDFSYGMGEGKMELFIGNKLRTSIEDISIEFEVPEGLGMESESELSRQLKGNAQMLLIVRVYFSNLFLEIPRCKVKFLLSDNTPRGIDLRIPVTLARLLYPIVVDNKEAFLSQWDNGDFPIFEAVAYFQLNETEHTRTILNLTRACTLSGGLRLHTWEGRSIYIGGFPFQSQEGISNFVIPTTEVIVDIETNKENPLGSKLRVRSRNDTVSKAICDTILLMVSDS